MHEGLSSYHFTILYHSYAKQPSRFVNDPTHLTSNYSTGCLPFQLTIHFEIVDRCFPHPGNGSAVEAMSIEMLALLSLKLTATWGKIPGT